MIKFFVALALLPSILFAKYELCICTVFKDDAKYLPEWIEFHLQQGVDHFYLYNNLSSDNPYQYLKSYLTNGTVTLIDWPYSYEDVNQWSEIQCNAIRDCIMKNKSKTNWLAIIDTDEFLFSPKGSLKDALNLYEPFSGVCVNMITYGTSNIFEIPDGEKIVDYLVWRAPDGFPAHHLVKSIVKPEKVACCVSPHFCMYYDGFAVNEIFQHVSHDQSPSISYETIRLNHYTTRDEKFLRTVKYSRRLKWEPVYKTADEVVEMVQFLNEFYDPILSKFSLINLLL